MKPPSMYERAMGDDFARLAPALQRFHRLSGLHRLHGQVVTGAPTTLAGRLLASLLGTPNQLLQGPLRFELDASPERETWSRFFPGKTMTSCLHREGRQLVETLGPARLVFALEARGADLVMNLQSLTFFGMPCPRALLPTVVAVEQGAGDTLEFTVRASLPGIGVFSSYHGHLSLPAEN